ncbi:hypothetical protein [Methanobrevibacter olleyae]|uniref:hypothetical protein n=1 Tax=Methanobrevibacter olleyae TaxID=294671 RepID=UPI00117C95EC|nr:hypothetical protein [Methanobrevibacter olleyae]
MNILVYGKHTTHLSEITCFDSFSIGMILKAFISSLITIRMFSNHALSATIQCGLLLHIA